MKTTLRIAKLELSSLFYSPIAWFISILFLFQCGLAYTSMIDQLLTSQQLGGEYARHLDFLTNLTFGIPYGILPGILDKVYLYVPLLTMGLISREMSSGTIKLLYSSPMRVSQIIFGKYLAMMAYNAVLLAILSVCGVLGMLNIHAADTGMILSGLFSVYLVLSAYAAIGLFMSCLTSYQVVAAISTFVVFAFLNYIGSVWQDIDFVRGLTFYLSISGRAEHLILGLIDTNDLIYFVVIVGAFLGFSIIRLQSGREHRPALAIAGRYAGVLAVMLVIGYISSVPILTGYLDTTATKTNTLNASTQKVLQALGKEPLRVTSYINLLDERFWQGMPARRNSDLQRWEPYLRFKSNIEFKYVYYYDSVTRDQHLMMNYPNRTLRQISEIFCKSTGMNARRFKTPEEIRKIIDLRPELNRYVMQLSYKGKTAFLRLFNDQMVFPSETETSAALLRLMMPMPRIVFLEGELERSRDKVGERSYGNSISLITNRDALINQGFDIDSVNLRDQDIPSDAAVLVIADPRANFSPSALEKLHRYIRQGGNLLIAGEPGKQNVLNPLLRPLGVRMMDGQLVQDNKDYGPDRITPRMTSAAAGLSKGLAHAFRDSVPVIMPGVAALWYTTDSGFSVTPLLVTDAKNSWNKKEMLDADSEEVIRSSAAGDLSGAFPTMLDLSRNLGGRTQHIVVSGDADFIDNQQIEAERGAGFLLAPKLFRLFTQGRFPIDTSRPDSKDKRIDLTSPGMAMIKLILLGILPGLLLVVGIVFLIRRKRK